MKRILCFVLPALFCFGGLVFGQKVTYNFDPDADFSKYKTYKWVAIEGGTYPDQLTDKQIKSAIESQLASKGLTKVEADNADLYVGYQVGLDKEKSLNVYGAGGPWAARWGGGMASATTSTVNIGQLVIDMYDPPTKQLIWRGMGTKEIDTNAKPEKRTKNLNNGVAKVFKNYPPKKK